MVFNFLSIYDGFFGVEDLFNCYQILNGLILYLKLNWIDIFGFFVLNRYVYVIKI